MHAIAATHTTKSFVKSLTISQRNALGTVLLHAEGAHQLRRELGVHKTVMISEHEHRTGLARLGRTSELFPPSCPTVINLVVED